MNYEIIKDNSGIAQPIEEGSERIIWEELFTDASNAQIDRIETFLKSERKFSDENEQNILFTNEKGNYEGAHSTGKIGDRFFTAKIGLKEENSYWCYNNRYFPLAPMRRSYVKHHESSIKNIKSIGRGKQVGILQNNIVKRLGALKSLSDNWDSYGAKEVTWYAFCNALMLFSEIIMNAKNMNIPQPFIAPISNGGLKIEWETLIRQFYFTIPPESSYNWEYSKYDLLFDGEKFYDVASNKSAIIYLTLNWFL